MREASEKIGVNLTNLSDCENNRKRPLPAKYNDQIIALYQLNSEETALLYDLSAKETNECPQDIIKVLLFSELGDRVRKELRDYATEVGI